VNARCTFEQDDFSSNRHPALTFCLRMSLFAKPVPTFAGHALLLAALLLAGHEARGANPPSVTDDIAPTRVIPAPVDMMPAAPRAPEPEPVETPTGQPSQAAAKPSEPSANPLWAIPLSRLTATRDRPLFLPSRRAAAPSIAAVPVTAPTPSAPPPAEPERPSLTLVGAIASETEGFAVFLDQATNTVIRLRTGQDHQGWVLRAVKGREATLVKASISTTLMLPDPGNIGAPFAPAIPADIRRQPSGEPEL
jgi:general secretion pathway protein N